MIPAILISFRSAEGKSHSKDRSHHSVKTFRPGVVFEIAVIHPMGIKKAAAIATAKKRNQTGVCRSVVVTRMAEIRTVNLVPS
jgi:hypothetical protein